MKNKRGFTLIELLAVISLLAIIMLIALPNVISVVDKNKKQTLLNDAKRFITLTEYYVSLREIPATGNFTLQNLHDKGVNDLIDDPDGGTYSNSSYVKIELSGDTYIYSVQLCGSKRHLPLTNSSSISKTSIVIDGEC